MEESRRGFIKAGMLAALAGPSILTLRAGKPFSFSKECLKREVLRHEAALEYLTKKSLINPGNILATLTFKIKNIIFGY